MKKAIFFLLFLFQGLIYGNNPKNEPVKAQDPEKYHLLYFYFKNIKNMNLFINGLPKGYSLFKEITPNSLILTIIFKKSKTKDELDNFMDKLNG